MIGNVYGATLYLDVRGSEVVEHTVNAPAPEDGFSGEFTWTHTFEDLDPDAKYNLSRNCQADDGSWLLYNSEYRYFGSCVGVRTSQERFISISVDDPYMISNLGEVDVSVDRCC